MSFTIPLPNLLVAEVKISLTDASKVITELTRKQERTVVFDSGENRRELFDSGGTSSLVMEDLLLDSLQGKYQRSRVLWQNEEMNKFATAYIRENIAVKWQPKVNLQSFTTWMNQLLPNHSLEPGFPRKTARKLQHALGFRVIDMKKDTYVDGQGKKSKHLVHIP